MSSTSGTASDTTALVVRGASNVGRAVVEGLVAAGVDPVVLDERTPAGDRTPSVRVPFDDEQQVRSAVDDVARDRGALDAVVFVPRPSRSGEDPWYRRPWERQLARELLAMAAVARAAAGWVSAANGLVVLGSWSGSPSSDVAPLEARGFWPVLEALADDLGFRASAVELDPTGTASAATTLVEATTTGLGSVRDGVVASSRVG
jgi:hypothetical protein